jgi:hypothetical protein
VAGDGVLGAFGGEFAVVGFLDDAGAGAVASLGVEFFEEFGDGVSRRRFQS